MPCLWLNHNNSQLFLNVGIIDASINLAAQPIIGANLPTPKMFKALVDTGAQKTMISTNVVNTLGLKSIGKILIQGVGSADYHNGYLFHVAFMIQVKLPGAPTPPPGQSHVLIHAIPIPIYGAEIDGNMGFDVLLGMDIICAGSLKVEGNGTYSFSF